MITIQLPITKAFSYGSGNAAKILGAALPKIVTPEINDICVCDFVQCEYEEKVFASQTPNNEWHKNDKNEFKQ